MGLTIHWRLKSSGLNRTQISEQLCRLRERALELPIRQIGPLVEYTGAATSFEQRERRDPHRWLLIQASPHVERDGHCFRVVPKHVIAFSILPGKGCEQANFGLCRYPAFVQVQEQQFDPRRGRVTVTKRIPTGLAGWRWSSFCKTEYASDPKCGGLENFLRCHLSVIAMLDCARSLGILEEVSDEGNYWEQRDTEALAKTVGQWNAMLAAFAGQLKDALGSANVVAPITKFPNFEHLEAQGQNRK